MLKTAKYYKIAAEEKKKKGINPWLAGGLAAATAAGGLAYANHRMDGALVDKAKGWFGGNGDAQNQNNQGNMESNARGGTPQGTPANPGAGSNNPIPKLEDKPNLAQQIDSQNSSQFTRNNVQNQMHNALFGN